MACMQSEDRRALVVPIRPMRLETRRVLVWRRRSWEQPHAEVVADGLLPTLAHRLAAKLGGWVG